VNDVNQQDAEAERLINRELMAKWASEMSESCGFDSHDIFYDEERAKDYEGAPKEENKYHVFLNKKVALEVLVHLFLGGAVWT